ncbi:hypothetical protein QYF36_024147 [Acer negundo]|nr:hypothetical protein QYF36_024147 [Acer negundo]
MIKASEINKRIARSRTRSTGSGRTVIDNMGRISLSQGFTNTHIYVSIISILNFLGRVGGGYFSEIIVRKFAYPRPVTMAMIQAIMAFAFVYYAMDWPGQNIHCDCYDRNRFRRSMGHCAGLGPTCQF